MSPSGNQVDGLPLALVRMLSQLVGFGPVERASKIYQKMYAVDKAFVEKSIANYQKVAFSYNKASIEGI